MDSAPETETSTPSSSDLGWSEFLGEAIGSFYSEGDQLQNQSTALPMPAQPFPTQGEVHCAKSPRHGPLAAMLLPQMAIEIGAIAEFAPHRAGGDDRGIVEQQERAVETERLFTPHPVGQRDLARGVGWAAGVAVAVAPLSPRSEPSLRCAA